jgi:hypothetical protein
VWLDASPTHWLDSSWALDTDGGNIDGLRHVKRGYDVFQDSSSEIGTSQIGML